MDREDVARKVSAMLRKAADESVGEAEALAFTTGAMALMAKYDLEELDLEFSNETVAKASYGTVRLDISYANGWRVHLANAIAHNTGLFCTYHGRSKTIEFSGKKYALEPSKELAEYLIRVVERLSTDYARATVSGTRGRRQFADGCAQRLRARIHESYNLTHDPRLPVLHKEAIAEGKKFWQESSGLALRGPSGRLGARRSGVGDAFFEGREAAENVQLRQPTAQLT